MKKFVFILSFVFAMFFANTTFAATTDNSSVNEKAQISLTETNQGFDVKDSINSVDGRVIVIVIHHGDGSVTVIVIIQH